MFTFSESATSASRKWFGATARSFSNFAKRLKINRYASPTSALLSALTSPPVSPVSPPSPLLSPPSVSPRPFVSAPTAPPRVASSWRFCNCLRWIHLHASFTYAWPCRQSCATMITFITTVYIVLIFVRESLHFASCLREMNRSRIKFQALIDTLQFTNLSFGCCSNNDNCHEENRNESSGGHRSGIIIGVKRDIGWNWKEEVAWWFPFSATAL